MKKGTSLSIEDYKERMAKTEDAKGAILQDLLSGNMSPEGAMCYLIYLGLEELEEIINLLTKKGK